MPDLGQYETWVSSVGQAYGRAQRAVRVLEQASDDEARLQALGELMLNGDDLSKLGAAIRDAAAKDRKAIRDA
jgi:hypothetical protein